MYQVTVLLLFSICNHVFLQPVLKPGQYIPKQLKSPVVPDLKLNVPLKEYHDNFYKKSIIDYIRPAHPEFDKPCFTCLNWITPVMLQHRERPGEHFLDDPNLLPNFLEVVSRKPKTPQIYVESKNWTHPPREPAFGLVIPKKSCLHDLTTWSYRNEKQMLLGRVELSNNDPDFPYSNYFNVYLREGRMSYNYLFRDMAGSFPYMRSAPKGMYLQDDVLTLRDKTIHDVPDDVLGGDFTVKYSITKSKNNEENCDLMISLGGRSPLEITENTLNQLPDGNIAEYPSNAQYILYTHDVYSNLALHRHDRFVGVTLTPNTIYLSLNPLKPQPKRKIIPLKDYTFKFFEHPNAFYSPIFTLSMFRECCTSFSFTINLSSLTTINLKFCEEWVFINGESIHTYFLKKHFKSKIRQYRFFVAPLNTDDIDDPLFPEKSQQIYRDMFNFVIYIIKEPSFDRIDDDQIFFTRPIYIHRKMKSSNSDNRRSNSSKGDLVRFILNNFTSECDPSKYQESLLIQGPGLRMVKVYDRKEGKQYQTEPTSRFPPFGAGQYDVTRYWTKKDPTLEPRTDPTFTERTTTVETISSARMPMGIIIGIMSAAMIIILLWVFFVDDLCCKESLKNKPLLIEPLPQTHTSLPQSIKKVPAQIRQSPREPTSVQQKKSHVKIPGKTEVKTQLLLLPPPKKKHVPVSTTSYPAWKVSNQESIPNTNASLLPSPRPVVPIRLAPLLPTQIPPRTQFVTCYEGITCGKSECVVKLSTASSIRDILPFTGLPDISIEGYFFHIVDLTTDDQRDQYKNFNFRLEDTIELQAVPNWDPKRGVRIYILEHEPAAFEMQMFGFELPKWISKLSNCQSCLKLIENDDVPTFFHKSETEQMNQAIKSLPTCWHFYANFIDSVKPNEDFDNVTGVYVFRTATDAILSPPPRSCYHPHILKLKALQGSARKTWEDNLEKRVFASFVRNEKIRQPSSTSLKNQGLLTTLISRRKSTTNVKTDKTKNREKASTKFVLDPAMKNPELVNEKLGITQTNESLSQSSMTIESELETQSTRKTEEESHRAENKTQKTLKPTPPNKLPLQGNSGRTVKPGGTAEVFTLPLSYKQSKNSVNSMKK